jgi:hypothetical protein
MGESEVTTGTLCFFLLGATVPGPQPGEPESGVFTVLPSSGNPTVWRLSATTTASTTASSTASSTVLLQ